MRRSLIIDTAARVVFHSALILSFYLLFTGHNQPGGGFVGGLVAAAAFGLVYVAGGIDDVRNLSRLRPWTILGTGLMLAAVAAMVPVFTGEGPLESGYIELDVPVLGHIKLISTLVFDIGVYGVVVGVVLMALEAFGEERSPAGEQEAA